MSEQKNKVVPSFRRVSSYVFGSATLRGAPGQRDLDISGATPARPDAATRTPAFAADPERAILAAAPTRPRSGRPG